MVIRQQTVTVFNSHSPYLANIAYSDYPSLERILLRKKFQFPGRAKNVSTAAHFFKKKNKLMRIWNYNDA